MSTMTDRGPRAAEAVEDVDPETLSDIDKTLSGNVGQVEAELADWNDEGLVLLAAREQEGKE